MSELGLESINAELPTRRSLHTEWVLPLFVLPRKTLAQIVKQETGVWAAPLLLLTLAVALLVFAQGPVRKTQAQMTSAMPEQAQYFSPEQQAQLQEGMAARQGPLFIYIFPAIGLLAGIWFGWFLLGSMLHLGLTMAGSRSGSTASFNLAAWASLPLIFRYLVRAVYSLSAHQMITSPGLSGFLSASAGGFSAYLHILLTLVDLYFIWQVALLLAGVVSATGLARKKAWAVTLLVVLVLLALQALPGFLLAQLGAVQTNQPFFFF